jgi:hypothetical protein
MATRSCEDGEVVMKQLRKMALRLRQCAASLRRHTTVVLLCPTFRSLYAASPCSPVMEARAAFIAASQPQTDPGISSMPPHSAVLDCRECSRFTEGLSFVRFWQTTFSLISRMNHNGGVSEHSRRFHFGEKVQKLRAHATTHAAFYLLPTLDAMLLSHNSQDPSLPLVLFARPNKTG